MPHLVIEYSANLEPALDVEALMAAVHEAAIETGVFPVGGIRTRAVARDQYRIADGHPDNGFVFMSVRVGAGRPPKVRQAAGERIFAALSAALDDLFEARPLSIGMEMSEIEAETSWKKNNLHEIVERRQKGSAA
jgi:5-carboxymethyl-2-hydroxymuconate isomerase